MSRVYACACGTLRTRTNPRAYFARRLVLYTIIKWTVYILHAWHADSVVDDFPTPVIL